MPDIIWKRGAEEDLLSTFSELETLRKGSGERFALMLDDVLQSLRSFPRLAPIYDRPVRRLVIGNSGYGIFYTVENRGIIIHALVHLRTNPGSIRTRIRKMLGL